MEVDEALADIRREGLLTITLKTNPEMAGFLLILPILQDRLD